MKNIQLIVILFEIEIILLIDCSYYQQIILILNN